MTQGEPCGRIMFLTLAACAAAGIGITLARAEPGPIGQWLMDEPVSLWDWGMRNTREAAVLAAEAVETEGVPQMSVVYQIGLTRSGPDFPG